MSISFFAKKPFRAYRDGHLQRVSSMIRGNQISQYLKAKLNPEGGYQDDVCIYVKPHVKSHLDFEFEGHPYLDIVDGFALIPLIQRHPEVSVITCSYNDFEYVSASVENPVYLIPQQHCNFEREKRTRKEVTKVGCIGTREAFDFLPEDLEKELKNRNMELITFSNFYKREDIKNFYKEIDVQIVWRPYMKKKKIPLSNPLKIVNAASFGVPTIALDEPAFKEMKGVYFPVEHFKGFFTILDRLRNRPELYEEYSKKCLEKSENYHIEKIAKLYGALR